MARMMDVDRLYSLRDAAYEMDITSAWLYRLIKTNEITVEEVAGYKVITREEIDRYLARKQESQTPVAA
jgi:hypothetical protein